MIRPEEHAFSLVETLISLGILAAVSVLVSNYYNRSSSNAAKLEARKATILSIDQTVNLLTRDVRLMPPGGKITCIDPNIVSSPALGCSHLSIKRYKEKNAKRTYTVRMNSRCEKIPNSLSNSFLSAADFANIQGPYENSCLHSLKCGSGSYPMTEITVSSGVSGGDYPEQIPLINQTSRRYMIGGAICMQDTGIHYSFIVEGAFMNEGNSLAVVSRKILLAKNNNGNLELLPTHDR